MGSHSRHGQFRVARASTPEITGRARAGLRELGRSAALLSIAAAVTAAGNLAFHIVLARSAGPNAYGATVGLLAFGTIAVHVQSGVQFSVARETARGESVPALLRGGALAVAPWAAAAAVLALASPAIASYLRISSALPVLFALAFALSLVVFGIPAGLFIGRRKFGLFALYSLLFFGLRFTLAAWLGWGRGAGRAALEATFIAMATTVLIAIAVVMRWHPADDTPRAVSRPVSIVKDSGYGALLSALLWTCWSLPVLFARHFLTPNRASSFGAAQLLVGGMLFLATPFLSALYPTIVQHRRSRDVQLGIVATLCVGLLGTVVATVGGPVFLHLVYGSRYSVPALEFLWLGLSMTAVGAATYALWVAHALRRHRRRIGAAIVIAVVAEAVLGGLWRGASALGAGPMVALAFGGLLAPAFVRRSARSAPAVFAVPPAGLDAREPGAGLLAFTAVGMMVHNEAATVEQCLRAVLAARDGDNFVSTIIVVVSGSTDGTDTICQRIAATEPRVRVIVERERSGKARAVNTFLARCDEPILALVNGDTLLARGTLALLVNALADPAVGMSGGRVVPVNPRRGVANRLAQAVWMLHHNVALHDPKLGEVVAFRRCFDSIDVRSGADEVSIEAEVRSAGYELRYVPEATVYNSGPRTLRGYVMHRTRNHRLHVHFHDRTGYTASTMRTRNQVRASIELVRSSPLVAPVVVVAAGLEVVARLVARLPRGKSRPPELWGPIASAKHRIEVVDLTGVRLPAAVADGTDAA